MVMAAVAVSGVAVVLPAVATVAVGDPIGEEADGGRTDKRGSRFDDLTWSPVGIVGGGATNARDKQEHDENQAVK